MPMWSEMEASGDKGLRKQRTQLSKQAQPAAAELQDRLPPSMAAMVPLTEMAVAVVAARAAVASVGTAAMAPFREEVAVEALHHPMVSTLAQAVPVAPATFAFGVGNHDHAVRNSRR